MTDNPWSQHWLNTNHTFTIKAPSYDQILETTRYHYMRKEEPMTVLERINQERKDMHERHRVEKLYEALDALDLDALIEGSVIRFNADEGPEVKTYAVLHAGGRWWATGGTAPNGVGLEDLLAWMIRKNVILDSVVVL